jgi:hypothetical protein
VDILYRWQREVLAGGDVTEEVGTGCCSQCAADGAGDVVVARCNISDQGAEDVERCAVSEALL